MEKLTSLPICRLLIIQYSFLKALLVALGSGENKLCFDDFRIDYVCICMRRKFRLTKEFRETCRRDEQTVSNRSGGKAKLSWNCMASLVVCVGVNS